MTTMLRRFYLLTGMATLALYGVVAFTGWEFGTPPRERIPADVRHSPGGYRSYHFWHAGYHGGK
jgi:hypothetical protein